MRKSLIIILALCSACAAPMVSTRWAAYTAMNRMGIPEPIRKETAQWLESIPIEYVNGMVRCTAETALGCFVFQTPVELYTIDGQVDPKPLIRISLHQWGARIPFRSISDLEDTLAHEYGHALEFLYGLPWSD